MPISKHTVITKSKVACSADYYVKCTVLKDEGLERWQQIAKMVKFHQENCITRKTEFQICLQAWKGISIQHYGSKYGHFVASSGKIFALGV